MAAEGWVAECPKCRCIILICAIDPQSEHMEGKATITPVSSCVATCPCCGSDYRYAGDSIVRGRPRKNGACLTRNGNGNGLNGALLVAASVVAAIRLRGEAIMPSPKLTATVGDSVSLAKLVMERIQRE